MKSPDFRSALMAYIREQAKPVDKFSHQPRLYELTREIGAGQNYDDDVVFAAVWLHDLGVFAGHRPANPAELAAWDSVAYAMKRTPDLLRQFGSIASLYERLAEVTSDRVRQNLAAAAAVVERNRELIRLRDDAGAPFNLAETVPGAEATGRLMELIERWGFRSMRQAMEAQAGPAQGELL